MEPIKGVLCGHLNFERITGSGYLKSFKKKIQDWSRTAGVLVDYLIFPNFKTMLVTFLVKIWRMFFLNLKNPYIGFASTSFLSPGCENSAQKKKHWNQLFDFSKF
jgi:hypothetical protein